MKQYFRSIIQLPPAVKWFLLTEMAFGLSMGIWNVNLNFHLKACGQTDLGIGSLLAFASVATALLSVFAGGLCDRIGFHPAMMSGCIIKGCGMIVIALAPNIGTVYAGLLIMSLGDALVLSCEFPFLLSLVEEELRNMVYNLLICSYLFAMFFGNLLGGSLPGMSAAMGNDYLVAVLLSGILFVLLGIARSFLPKKKVDYTAKKVSFELLKDRKILFFLLYGVILSVAYNILASMLNLIFRDSFHLKDSSVGVLYSMSTIVMFISAFLVPVIAGRRKSGNAAIMFMAVNIPVLVLMSIAEVNMFIFLWLLYSFFRMLLPGTVDCRMLQAVPADLQGSYSGLRIFANSIGTAAGAGLAGLVLEYADYTLILLGGALFTGLQLAVYLRCRKYLPKAAAAAECG
jgi:DHA1 family multidrug resistance protein-like MFS transporter